MVYCIFQYYATSSNISGSKGVLTSLGEGGGGRGTPYNDIFGGHCPKEVYERVGISIISALNRRALWPGTIFQPESIRNSKLPITSPAGLIQLRTGF